MPPAPPLRALSAALWTALLAGTPAGAAAAKPAGTAAAAPAADARPFGENVLLERLGPDWKVGHQQRAGQRAIVEFVHHDETVEDWTELATLLVLDDAKGIALAGYVDSVRAALKQRCREGGRVRALKFERWSGLPAVTLQVECARYANGEAESYVQLAVAGREALYSLQIARKVPRIDAALSREWARFVKKLRVCDDLDPARPCRAR